jgi:hypothetical protein
MLPLKYEWPTLAGGPTVSPETIDILSAGRKTTAQPSPGS